MKYLILYKNLKKIYRQIFEKYLLKVAKEIELILIEILSIFFTFFGYISVYKQNRKTKYNKNKLII